MVIPIHFVLLFSENLTASATLEEVCPDNASCRFLRMLPVTHVIIAWLSSHYLISNYLVIM